MELVFSILNSLGLVGLAIFLWFVWHGLTDRIKSLRELTEEQGKTLAVVRERAEEVDRLSQRYKQALLDFEEMSGKVESRRKQLVAELEEANKKKDEEIILLKKAELAKIEKEQESLERISELAAQIDKLKQQQKAHAAAITELDPLSSMRNLGWMDGLMLHDKDNLDLTDVLGKITRNIAKSMKTGSKTGISDKNLTSPDNISS